MNKNTLKAAVKNHSEAVLNDIDNAVAYLVKQSYTEDEANEIIEAITSSEVEKPSKETKSKEVVEVPKGYKLYEVWQLDSVTNERLKVKKTLKGQPHFVDMLNEQKLNTKLEYVEVK